MKFELKDDFLLLKPEDEADVFNLGKISPHFSRKAIWDSEKVNLKYVRIHIKDFYAIFCMLLEKNEHHFIQREL